MNVNPRALLIAAAAGVAVALVVAFAPWSRSQALSAHRMHQPGQVYVPSPRPAWNQGAVPQNQVQQGLAQVVAAVRPSVVSIGGRRDLNQLPPGAGMQFLQPFPLHGAAVGSGVVVHPEGLILTSRQVAGGASEVTVGMFRADRATYTARQVASDPSSDLALYRLTVGGRFPFALLGDSSAVRTGDIVVAVGSPFGLSETATHGIVSTTRRTVNVQGQQLTDVIQTDAAINQGNSGGPLVDIRAQVIGINAAIYSTSASFTGIGFAIPSNRARAFIQSALGW